jgi:hypothetical protein
VEIALEKSWNTAIIFVVGCLLTGFYSLSWAQRTLDQVWNEEWTTLSDQIKKGPSPDNLAKEVLNPQALINSTDRDPLDVIERRTAALVASYRKLGKTTFSPFSSVDSKISALRSAMQSMPVSDVAARQTGFAEVMAANREAMLANSAFDFDTVIAMLETFVQVRIVEGARPGAHAVGGGPVMITGLKGSSPKHAKLLTGIKVSSGSWAGKELTGKFSGLELNWEGTQIYFAATTNDNFWHIFRFDLDSKKLDQLTDEKYDDFDPCVLPSGRIVFNSTRRGGIGRCLLTTQSLTFTLHSMEPDGSDIVPISFHETNDWQPSVDNHGMIVYNRWDYFDRHWGTAHHLFLCYPDGRDPRNYHGNYPLPRDVMTDGITPEQYGTNGSFPNGRNLREDVDMTLRAVPGTSSKYTATAVGHHEGFSGTLIMIDINIPDDGKMSQVKRITPDVKFPEVEGGTHTYGTCWPLDETTFMCNYNKGLYLVDDNGNRQVLYDPGNLGDFRIRDPFPLRPRTKPSSIPVLTYQGKRSALPEHQPATISVVNCYLTDSIPRPIPAGTKIKWLRIIQIIPQLLTRISGGATGTISYMSAFDESTGRIPLGIVPVEDDGSVYCEAPVNKALYFQLLDSNGMAIHSMRTVAYVHSGEKLVCTGCHEDKWESPPASGIPVAFLRQPSKIIPEVEDGAIPFNFHRLVEWPLFQTKCLPCHKKENKGLTDMSYGSVAKYRLAFGFQGEEGFTWKGTGGSRTTPGRFGAYASGIWKALNTKTAMKDVVKSMTKEELKRLTLWLEMNSNRLCWESDDQTSVDAQRKGDVVWPTIDIVPYNPTGVEYLGTDNEPPGAVSGVQLIQRSAPVSHIQLRWQPAVDNESGVGAYKVYRNSKLLCTVPDLMYVDRAVSAGTSYAYEVAAVDRTGREGPKTKADDVTAIGGELPQAFNPLADNRPFEVRALVGGRSIVVMVNIPGTIIYPANIALFTVDGRLLSRVVASQGDPGMYTTEINRHGSAGVYLCKVEAGPYRKLLRIVNTQR